MQSRKRKRLKLHRGKKAAREFMESGKIPTDYQNKDIDNNFEPQKNQSIPRQRNTKAIPNIASMRHHTGLRETVKIATATLIDFKL